MIVTRLELRNFTVHTCFVLDLPARGVVLVTGANGAGKSSILEGVSVGVWGETLRGKSCWTEEAGQVAVSVNLATGSTLIDRRRVGGRNELSVGGEKYDTASKGQEVLAPLVGSHELWRRSCAFSSRDSAHFTESGDADRKRLLESILGLDRLDAASGLVRKDMRDTYEALQGVVRRSEMLEQKVELLTAQMRQDAEELRALQEPADKPVEVAELRRRKQKLEKEVGQIEADSSGMQHTMGKLEQQVLESKARAVKVSTMGRCPTCGQSVREGWSNALLHESVVLENSTEAHISRLQQEQGQAAARLKVTRQKLDKVRAALSSASVINTAYANYLHGKEHLGKRVEARRQELTELGDEQDEVERQVDEVRSALAHLEVVDKVLSTKGVRAHLLHNALSYIETTANYWLDRVAGAGLRLHLTPYSEKASGGVRDAIGLEVEGAGGGNGYKGASGGERRRIDIALMLALGDIARASHGSGQPSTLFMDEVFDALDSDGVAAVCSVVSDLAQHTCVVVISHNEDVVRGLQNVQQHVRLEKA